MRSTWRALVVSTWRIYGVWNVPHIILRICGGLGNTYYTTRVGHRFHAFMVRIIARHSPSRQYLMLTLSLSVSFDFSPAIICLFRFSFVCGRAHMKQGVESGRGVNSNPGK
jgi:hypothetical protein